MSFVTLNDGREVTSDSPEWRDECLQRERHVATLLRMVGRQERVDYVRRLRDSEGFTAAERVKARLQKDRDELRDLVNDLSAICDDANEAVDCLEQAADALSRYL